MNPITFNFTGSFQTYTFTQAGNYTVTAYGAQGGGSENSIFGISPTIGGLGASVSGNFAFQANDKLLFVIGDAGQNGWNQAGGGGGGTFVYLDADRSNTITVGDQILLAAGGGGGGGFQNDGNGGLSIASGAGNGSGGAAGSAISGNNGGGGAGINGSGATATSDRNGVGAPSITSSGSGNIDQSSGSVSGGNGGYGGGGGAGFNGGGGGGGYTGGSGGNGQTAAGGGGGSSFIASSATSQVSQAAVQSGDGRAVITCYVTGTRIRVMCDGAEADVPVEHLVVGHLAVTASGEHRPIRWIGSRRTECRRHPRPDQAQPVRIRAGALGANRPARDLCVSPAHAIALDLLGEVLIPAIALVNGTTIVQVDVEEVTYWHVELDSHDILLAEGLPAESYLDMGNRAFFEFASIGLGPDTPAARSTADFCRPFHEAGPVVDLVRARLEDRAVALGWHKIEEAFAGLHIVADGRSIRPDVEGLTARFVLAADARDVRLVSATSVPAHVVLGSSDDRRLGVALAALSIDDGLTGVRVIKLDDAHLGEGFHGLDDGARWTDGSAALPADLWNGCKGSFFLRVTLACPALARWVAPGETSGVVQLAGRRQA